MFIKKGITEDIEELIRFLLELLSKSQLFCRSRNSITKLIMLHYSLMVQVFHFSSVKESFAWISILISR